MSPDTAASTPTLPVLTADKQVFYSDCCLSISSKTISQILSVLPSQDAFVLSIGSGAGLLEALLMDAAPDLWIEVAEVQAVNKYISDEMVHVVKGTWDISSRATKCDALMFVYPREPDLITKYLATIDAYLKVRAVIWIGPNRDWSDFMEVFGHSSFIPSESTVLSASEKLVSFRRRP